jgi:hypothetical protein
MDYEAGSPIDLPRYQTDAGYRTIVDCGGVQATLKRATRRMIAAYGSSAILSGATAIAWYASNPGDPHETVTRVASAGILGVGSLVASGIGFRASTKWSYARRFANEPERTSAAASTSHPGLGR